MEDGKRPDGETTTPFANGKCLVWDSTVSCPLATTYVVEASTGAGKIAERAERKKDEKYASLSSQYQFAAFSFETFGPWGPSAKKYTAQIGKMIQDRTGEKRSLSFLRQSISIAIQRGNAASVFATPPSSKGLDAIYYILDVKRTV